MKNKNHMIISIDAEKASDKIQQPFMIQNSPESRHRRNIPQDTKGHIQWTHSKHYSQWWKTESTSSKIRNKIRKPTLTTIIQHSFGSPSHSNQRRKRNKRNAGWKRSKTRHTDDMILYIENPKDATRKLLELINEYSKIAG